MQLIWNLMGFFLSISTNEWCWFFYAVKFIYVELNGLHVCVFFFYHLTLFARINLHYTLRLLLKKRNGLNIHIYSMNCMCFQWSVTVDYTEDENNNNSCQPASHSVHDCRVDMKYTFDIDRSNCLLVCCVPVTVW